MTWKGKPCMMRVWRQSDVPCSAGSDANNKMQKGEVVSVHSCGLAGMHKEKLGNTGAKVFSKTVAKCCIRGCESPSKTICICVLFGYLYKYFIGFDHADFGAGTLFHHFHAIA